MSKKLRSAGRQTLSVFLSAATAITLTGSAFIPMASAVTTAELQAQIATLLAQITALQTQLAAQGGTTPATQCSFTRDLYVGGPSGDDVKCLQQYLNGAGQTVSATGAGSAGNETTFFGSRTQAAVSKWQQANTVSPTAGYFGLKSRTKYNALVATTPPPVVPPPGDGTTPPPVAGTGLTVTAGTQPSATLAPEKAINIPYTRVKFTASADGDVTVNSLVVERTGLMNDAALAGVILLDENGNRIGNPKTLNSDHKATLNESFVVKAGTTREMTIAGDMATSLDSYAGQVGFLSLSAVNTSAQVNATLPIVGSGHTTNANLSLATVTVARGGMDPNGTTTKDVGTKAFVFSAVKATADSAEDVTWKSIRFYQSGSVSSSDLSNIVVKDLDGTLYSTTVSSDGKYYTAVLGTGIKIGKGLTKEVYIQGDIESGSARTIAFDVWQLEDIVFKGETYNYDIKPSAGTSFTTAVKPRYQGSQFTIGTGSLIVSKANTVASQNIVSGGTGVPLGGFEFEVKGEPVTFTSWTVTVTSTDNDGGSETLNLTNISVLDSTGKVLAGPIDANMSTGVFTLTDSITLPVGKNVLTFKGNLNTNWENNDTIQLSFTPSSAVSSITGQTTNTTITASPSSSVSGQTMTVKAGALTVAPGSFASTTVIANASGIELGKINVDASASGDDLKITIAKLRKNSNGGDTVNNLRLRDGSKDLNTGSNVADPTANNEEDLTFTFDVPFVMTKGTSKTLSVIGDISSSATSSSYVKFDLTGGTSNNDWTVTTVSQGSDVTESLTTSDAKGVTFESSGGYKVEADVSKPSETWVYSGQKGVTLNVLKFSATSEAMALTDLRFRLDITGSSTGSQIDRLELWEGSTLLSYQDAPNFTGSVQDFTFPQTGTGSFVIPKDGSKILTVKADLAPIAISGNGVSGTLLGVDYSGGGATAAIGKNKAVGVGSGNSVHSSTQSDQTGNGVVTFRAVPQVAKDTSLSTNATGQGAIYRFTVKAVGGEIKLNRVTIRVATSNITGLGQTLPSTNGIRLYSVTRGGYVSTATAALAAYFTATYNYDADPATGALIVRLLANNTGDSNVVATNGEYRIGAGETHSFEVRIDNYTDDSTAGGSLSTTLLGDAARPVKVTLAGTPATRYGLAAKVSLIDVEQGGSAGGNTCGTGNTCSDFGVGANAATSTNFIWSDLGSEATSSANTNSINTADWMNGFKISGLPTTGLDTHTMRF